MKNTKITLEYVEQLNALPEAEKQAAVDALTTQQALEVARIVLERFAYIR